VCPCGQSSSSFGWGIILAVRKNKAKLSFGPTVFDGDVVPIHSVQRRARWASPLFRLRSPALAPGSKIFLGFIWGQPVGPVVASPFQTTPPRLTFNSQALGGPYRERQLVRPGLLMWPWCRRQRRHPTTLRLSAHSRVRPRPLYTQGRLTNRPLPESQTSRLTFSGGPSRPPATRRRPPPRL